MSPGFIRSLFLPGHEQTWFSCHRRLCPAARRVGQASRAENANKSYSCREFVLKNVGKHRFGSFCRPFYLYVLVGNISSTNLQ